MRTVTNYPIMSAAHRALKDGGPRLADEAPEAVHPPGAAPEGICEDTGARGHKGMVVLRHRPQRTYAALSGRRCGGTESLERSPSSLARPRGHAGVRVARQCTHARAPQFPMRLVTRHARNCKKTHHERGSPELRVPRAIFGAAARLGSGPDREEAPRRRAGRMSKASRHRVRCIMAVWLGLRPHVRPSPRNLIGEPAPRTCC